MAENSDSGEKTEEPTQKRIDDAVKKGQVAFSREVTNFMMLVALALNIIWFAPYYSKQAVYFLSGFIHSPHDMVLSDAGLINIFSETSMNFGIFMLLPLLAAIFVAFFSSFIQNGVIISSESIIPKLDKISIFKGVKRMFSMRSFMEFIKGLIKISLVGIVSFLVIRPEINAISHLSANEVIGIIAILQTLGFKIVLGACSVMIVIALLDYLYQKFEYIKSLKMTKQELKEEFKQSEGDPQIKGRLKQIRMERARKRMMAAVPEADVIIRNPTHFAIALKYDGMIMSAPIVLAKGQDNIALKIIDIADEHDIPTVRNPPLARALYDTAKLDEEIPLEHYQAVAEVIGYVYKLKDGR